MEIAQAATTNLTNETVTTPVVPSFTVSVPMLIIGLLILAVVFLIIWALAANNKRATYSSGQIAGSKGGHVRKRVTEYEDVSDNE